MIIFRIDSLCYSRDYHRRFVLLVFWVLLLLESYLRIWIGLLSWFYLVLVSVPQGCCFIVLHILFLFLFESSISFIFLFDRFASYSLDYHRSFFLLVFWFLLLLESYIYIYIRIALPSWFYLVLVSVAQEPQEGETRGVSV